MRYYAAPMEGITTYIYRRAHARWYGGIDRYFTPFIAGKKMTAREKRDILPENNSGVPLIPQILTNKVEDFLAIAEKIASYGYDTVNLNLGCPSGTVTAKKRGAGFLGDPDGLDAFLYEIYAKCPLKISIKTRLGVANLREWDRLLAIYAKYPIEELIVHTRLLQEFYTGKTHPEAFGRAVMALGNTKIPLCYNGDILSPKNCQHDAVYGADRVMIGRGLLRDPALATKMRATENPSASQAHGSDSSGDVSGFLPTLRAFHDEILAGYREIMSGDLPVLFKMKDLWTYMIFAFTDPDAAPHRADSGSEPPDTETVMKYLKKIRKANHLSEYSIAVDNLFREIQVP